MDSPSFGGLVPHTSRQWFHSLVFQFSGSIFALRREKTWKKNSSVIIVCKVSVLLTIMHGLVHRNENRSFFQCRHYCRWPPEVTDKGIDICRKNETKSENEGAKVKLQPSGENMCNHACLFDWMSFILCLMSFFSVMFYLQHQQYHSKNRWHLDSLSLLFSSLLSSEERGHLHRGDAAALVFVIYSVSSGQSWARLRLNWSTTSKIKNSWSSTTL